MKFYLRNIPEKLIHTFDPNFKHRWQVYNEAILELVAKDKIWLDCGCGNNEKVSEFKSLAKLAYGVDILIPQQFDDNFIKADLKLIPFKANTIDLITLRFVVEHFYNPNIYFEEFSKILKQNGKILIITTNINSPLIFLPNYLFPQKVKEWVIAKIFKVKGNEIFRTHHSFNSLKGINYLPKFKLKKIEYLSDLNTTRTWMFSILFLFHLITKPKVLNKFRTNFIFILEKV